MSHVLAVATSPEDWGGILLILFGFAAYAVIALVDYVRDVRFYRARRIVRNRGGVR